MSTKEAEQKTISTLFFLRALGIFEKNEKIETSKMKDFGFRQAYIADVFKEPLTKYPVYLLFKQEKFTSAFQEFIDAEYEKGRLRQDYDYPGGFVVLEYEFPKSLREDYTKVLKGQYSQTSARFKEIFPERMDVNGMEKWSFYYRVFNKTPDMVKLLKELIGEDSYEEGMEVWSSPYMEKETLDITKYIDYE